MRTKLILTPLRRLNMKLEADLKKIGLLLSSEEITALDASLISRAFNGRL